MFGSLICTPKSKVLAASSTTVGVDGGDRSRSSTMSRVAVASTVTVLPVNTLPGTLELLRPRSGRLTSSGSVRL